MTTTKKTFAITRGKVIFDYSALYCDTAEKLLKSELFLRVVDGYIERIASKGSPSFAFLRDTMTGVKRSDIPAHLVNFFRLLTSHSAEETAAMNPEYQRLLSNREDLLEMIEGLYNFWRRLERFFYIEAPKRSMYAKNRLHHAQFIKANEEFKDLVLHVYRSISENVTGQNPRVYRQLPAGANIGMLTEKIDWDCPAAYAGLADVPFIRLSLIEPPLIIYPVMNTRKGSFEETGKVADGTFDIDSGEWFCFPAKVGDLTAFIFFHQDFISLGLSLSNLFEIATYEEIDGKRPDLMIAFGLPKDRLAGSTMFYEDKENGMLVGMVGHSEEVDYFGYFKKMTLTLHNIAMLNRGRLPLHGAMAYIKLKDGGSANVVIVGDSGAGKSETIEALRTLAEDHICEMRVIFDDMGSLGINADGRVAGYGTEIGAFVRLDDLQAGYAYEEIDRSIFMNPHKINSRLVIPITRYHHLVKGYPVDVVLYANNYDQTDADHPPIEFFDRAEDALSTFRSGARLAKGTTDEKGLVHTYFANPFGAPQRRESHEKCAADYFGKMFGSGVKVGQIRTRLGIEGFEQEGPKAASMELFKIIREISKKGAGGK